MNHLLQRSYNQTHCTTLTIITDKNITFNNSLKVCSERGSGYTYHKHVRVFPQCRLEVPILIIDREAREIMHLVASVCPFVCALTAEPFDLRAIRVITSLRCLSVISGRRWIVARMRSIGVLIDRNLRSVVVDLPLRYTLENKSLNGCGLLPSNSFRWKGNTE